MVESCGEVFVIYLVHGGKLFVEVTGVEVFKLDFSLMEWIKVECAKDRAFFVDEKAAYSCPALKPETEGNRIFFTLSDDKSLYSIDIEENSVSVSLPCTDLKPPWSTPIWVMPDLSLSPVHRRMEKIEPDQIEDIVPCVESKNKEEIGYFCELPLDLLSSVASCLVLHDYMNFRVVNRICRLAAPPIHWPATIKKLVRHSLAPWLMVCKKGQDKCKFIDPLHRERYLMNNPNKSSDVRMCYSKEGWCLMLQGEYTIFFWNPFTKKIILLPKLPHEFKTIIGCDFSSSPDSSGCLLVLIYILVGEGHWESLYAFKWKDFKLSKNNNPVFYNEELYLLGSEGNLGVFREGFIWEVLDKPQRPCKSFYQSFLLQGNGKLLSVFVGFMGKWLKVFELNLSTMNWVEIDNVRDKVIHVSRISSFSTAATTEEMRNTVCLPRFYEDNLVYYSLDYKKYHFYGSNVVMEDFYNTKEQLYSGWIEPRW
ncbi:F-box protein At3g56470-like [Durio zibethinus]|uniref:F-box protein At3g56470-like n=1 Tax=Durio zibethinus TaxID=66656 RepID=A0A6P5Y1I9_DURZI|nr:F-box protein At3g56470-like [Durio zibethinus]XP_022734310.1 F-box protein At3g56470-like [Durio zibethinus]